MTPFKPPARRFGTLSEAMFITAKRHEREKQEMLGASNRLTEAILENCEQGLFLLDARDKMPAAGVARRCRHSVPPAGLLRI